MDGTPNPPQKTTGTMTPIFSKSVSDHGNQHEVRYQKQGVGDRKSHSVDKLIRQIKSTLRREGFHNLRVPGEPATSQSSWTK